MEVMIRRAHCHGDDQRGSFSGGDSASTENSECVSTVMNMMEERSAVLTDDGDRRKSNFGDASRVRY